MWGGKVKRLPKGRKKYDRWSKERTRAPSISPKKTLAEKKAENPNWKKKPQRGETQGGIGSSKIGSRKRKRRGHGFNAFHGGGKSEKKASGECEKLGRKGSDTDATGKRRNTAIGSTQLKKGKRRKV